MHPMAVRLWKSYGKFGVWTFGYRQEIFASDPWRFEIKHQAAAEQPDTRDMRQKFTRKAISQHSWQHSCSVPESNPRLAQRSTQKDWDNLYMFRTWVSIFVSAKFLVFNSFHVDVNTSYPKISSFLFSGMRSPTGAGMVCPAPSAKFFGFCKALWLQTQISIPWVFPEDSLAEIMPWVKWLHEHKTQEN